MNKNTFSWKDASTHSKQPTDCNKANKTYKA